MIRPFLNQDFNSLKSELLAEGRLFEDETFPSNHNSIYRDKDFTGQKIEWKRPSELFAEPKFFLDSIQPADLDHGLLKKCHLIDSIPALLNNRDNFYRTIPDDQNFSESSYAGIFHFRFWLNGQWIDVVVDDRLPVNEQNQLLFCNNRAYKNEMYGPLLEKAYAKFKVCYEFLSDLALPEILLDFTGAVAEQYNLTRCLPTQESDRYLCPNRLWEILCKYSTSLKPNQRMDQLLSIGIHGEKEYTISKIYEILKLDEQFNAFRDLKGPKPQHEVQRSFIKCLNKISKSRDLYSLFMGLPIQHNKKTFQHKFKLIKGNFTKIFDNIQKSLFTRIRRICYSFIDYLSNSRNCYNKISGIAIQVGELDRSITVIVIQEVVCETIIYLIIRKSVEAENSYN
ncbi:calpain-2 catalytic subunit-like [Brachionus plicatilis]|uniref:Calpain-2 catalytic subunit-like n=1 Tax=Brachionus plicatilis TaxID=10195 RepID=A0A3M7RJS5_BRAPC|nr:calpain-2 catalytic subunit-like [Brachionus plicatilis]